MVEEVVVEVVQVEVEMVQDFNLLQVQLMELMLVLVDLELVQDYQLQQVQLM